jgi:hypothetical protein
MKPMARPQGTQLKSTTTWYLREWMTALEKIQADLTKELDWPKAKANRVFNGQQRYNEDLVLELAAWLNLRPYELLLPPKQAMAIRRLRDDAVRIASDAGALSEAPAVAVPELIPGTGTHG